MKCRKALKRKKKKEKRILPDSLNLLRMLRTQLNEALETQATLKRDRRAV